MPTVLPQEEAVEAERMYLAGHTLTDIGSTLGYTREVVSFALRARGVETASGVRSRRRRGNWDERDEKIETLYRSGLSKNEVARQVGVPPATVTKVLQRRGVPERPVVHRYTQHGTVNCYMAGCHCDECCAASTERNRKVRDLSRLRSGRPYKRTEEQRSRMGRPGTKGQPRVTPLRARPT